MPYTSLVSAFGITIGSVKTVIWVFKNKKFLHDLNSNRDTGIDNIFELSIS